jgi:hypothetical protein
MDTPEQPQMIRIELTGAQRDELRRLTGRDADALELRVEELEERIAPKLAANHNETLLSA